GADRGGRVRTEWVQPAVDQRRTNHSITEDEPKPSDAGLPPGFTAAGKATVDAGHDESGGDCRPLSRSSQLWTAEQLWCSRLLSQFHQFRPGQWLWPLSTDPRGRVCTPRFADPAASALFEEARRRVAIPGCLSSSCWLFAWQPLS